MAGNQGASRPREQAEPVRLLSTRPARRRFTNDDDTHFSASCKATCAVFAALHTSRSPGGRGRPGGRTGGLAWPLACRRLHYDTSR